MLVPLLVALFSNAISFGAFLFIKLFLPFVFLIVVKVAFASWETLQRRSGALFQKLL